jgi:hypothetical protein
MDDPHHVRSGVDPAAERAYLGATASRGHNS